MTHQSADWKGEDIIRNVPLSTKHTTQSIYTDQTQRVYISCLVPACENQVRRDSASGVCRSHSRSKWSRRDQ